MRFLLADLKILFTLVIISAVLIYAEHLGVLNLPKSILGQVTNPIQYGMFRLGSSAGKQFEFLTLIRRGAQENKALRAQLADLITENANLRKELSETKKLVKQNEFLSPNTFELMPSKVIGYSRYLSIDKGSEDGIAIGSIVVYKDNYIGRVTRVNPKTSQVMLAQDPDSKVAVYASNKSGKARGILTGQFGSELQMGKILHQEKIDAGDLVYSEGTEGQLPRGLIIGKVSKVIENQNEVFKQAVIKTVFEIPELEVVFLIKNI